MTIIKRPIVDLLVPDGQHRTIRLSNGHYGVPSGISGSFSNPISVPKATSFSLWIGLDPSWGIDNTEPGGNNVGGMFPRTWRHSGPSYLPFGYKGKTNINLLNYEAWPEDELQRLVIGVSIIGNPDDPDFDPDMMILVEVWLIREVEGSVVNVPPIVVDTPSPLSPLEKYYSQLWGREGELYKPEGRLRDFSQAGLWYDHVPTITEANVSTQHELIEAIEDLRINYIHLSDNISLTKQLIISRKHLTIDGHGYFINVEGSLLDILGPKEGTGVTGNWSWSGGLITIRGEGGNFAAIQSIKDNHLRGTNHLLLKDAYEINYNIFQPFRIILSDRDGNLGRYLHSFKQEISPNLRNIPLVDFGFAPLKLISNDILRLDRPLPVDIKTEWLPMFGRSEYKTEDVVIKDLIVKMPDRTYDGHWQEQGWNAFSLENVFNCKLENIEIKNADNGIFLDKNSRNCELSHIRLTSSVNRPHRNGTMGHHGIQVSEARENLIQNVTIYGEFVHDITVQYLASLNVFSNIAGRNVNLDHHTGAPFMNLFTEIYPGDGDRLFKSSGSTGPSAGREETFWYVSSDFKPDHNPPWPEMIMVGVGVENFDESMEAWNEPLVINPKNIYKAQKGVANLMPDTTKVSAANGIYLIPNDQLSDALDPEFGHVKQTAVAGNVFLTSPKTVEQLIDLYGGSAAVVEDDIPTPVDEPTPTPTPTETADSQLINKKLDWIIEAIRGNPGLGVGVIKADKKVDLE